MMTTNMFRLSVPLAEEEYSALSKVAEAELRDIRLQAAYFILRELERRGLLSPNDTLSPDAECGGDIEEHNTQ